MAIMCIDIGGTTIKAGLVEMTGAILEKTQVKTPKDSYEKLLSTLRALVEWGKQFSEVEGIAISQPCSTDPLKGTCLSEGALIYILGKNPAKDLGDAFMLPYAAENDGNCAALAEVWKGSAQELQDVVSVVCGTGVGGAIVKNRKIHHGSKLFAGEIGMCITSFDEVTQKPQTWSEYGSTLALVKDYEQKSHISSGSIDGKQVLDLADQGDDVAKACVKRFYARFAIGLHNIQHIYDPECILSGGGISSRPNLLHDIEAALDALYEPFDLVMSRPAVGICKFQADANLIGAAYHWMSIHGEKSL